MQIFLNGVPHECAGATTLAMLLDDTGHAQRRVAVEVNHEIVSHSMHIRYVLNEGDRVEVVTALGGG